MAVLTDLIFFSIFIFVLSKSSVYVVRSITNISSFLKLTEFTSGFIILALATTLPELFVGINSAINHTPTISLGNVIGSNIANISLVLGIVILVGHGIKIKSKAIGKDSIYMLIIAFLPILLMSDGLLSRTDGAILILIFIFYIYKILKEKRRFGKKLNKVTGYEVFNNIVLFITSIIMLLVASNFIVKFAVNIANDLNVSSMLIALLLVAVGTSIPELTLGIRSVLSGHRGLTIGNLIGAVATNSTLVLGITALIMPIVTEPKLFFVSSFFVLAACILFVAFIYTNNKLTIKEGLLLLLFYGIFIFTVLALRFT